MSFEKIGLLDPLVQGILATGYTAPTEIQSQAIPAAINNKDIIACAQTGTGKTAAFVLPILNRLPHEKRSRTKAVQALIVTPTRELAVQIEQSIAEYGRFLNIKAAAIYGGVKIGGQLKSLKQGVNIVVATPGRLMDHMQRKTINLKHIEVLVLDEADRMLDMGFINDMRKIIATLPEKRQTMLFSATISQQVKSLAQTIMKDPQVIQIGRQRNPIETITQHIYPVEKDLKGQLLVHLIKDLQMFSVLVFSRTKHGADKIRRKLHQADIEAIAIHSDRTQGQRQRALDGFKSGKYHVMVATDIAARGIDVEGISHVINYDVPVYAEDYIHRIGRTGRATTTGDAITFVSRDEEKYLRKIEGYIGKKFEHESVEGYTHIIPDVKKKALDRWPSKGRLKRTAKKTRRSARKRK